MNSEKVKEIKKALEFNANYEHYNKLGFIDGYKCKTAAYADILTYINKLESENSKLKQHKRELEGGQRDLLKVIKEFVKETQIEEIAKIISGSTEIDTINYYKARVKAKEIIDYFNKNINDLRR